MKLISLKTDYAFRELFSYENVRKQFLSDVLGIPLEEIKRVRITSPFLWKRRARQKQGILDMALELENGAKVMWSCRCDARKAGQRELCSTWRKCTQRT